MPKLDLTDITSGYSSATVQNANNVLVETALENTLSRDGTAPNTMSANLDMNSNKVVNVADATNNQDAVTLAQLNAASVVAATAAASAVTVADAGAHYAATTVEAALAELGATTGAAIVGVLDTAAHFAGADVEAVLAELQVNIDGVATGLVNVVEDTTPQLGGALDANSQVINMGDFAINRPLLTDFGITSNSLVVTANAVAINLTTGNSFVVDLEAATGTVTITLSNPPASGRFGECIIRIQQDTTASRTITWAGGTFRWQGGAAPTMTAAADAIDIFTFKTWDGGTTWYGDAGQAYS